VAQDSGTFNQFDKQATSYQLRALPTCSVPSLPPVGSADLQRDTVLEPNPSHCNQSQETCGGAVNCCEVCDDALLGGKGRAGCGGRREVCVATILLASIMNLFQPQNVTSFFMEPESSLAVFLASAIGPCSESD
jgi:hypothetical protein